MFKDGQWVVDIAGGLGFIRDKESDTRYYVVFPNSRFAKIRNEDELEPAPEFTPDELDIYSMQHLAVESNDKDWYDELGCRLSEVDIRK